VNTASIRCAESSRIAAHSLGGTEGTGGNHSRSLIPKDEEEEDDDRDPFREAFGHHDLDFIPASPSQGHSYCSSFTPRTRLKLIRRLIDHAILFRTGGPDFGANAITITSLDGSGTIFPWSNPITGRGCRFRHDYRDLRAHGAGSMGHRRIEAGEPSIRCSGRYWYSNPPAAYLLVAVDLLLSHWPKSRVAAIPFSRA